MAIEVDNQARDRRLSVRDLRRTASLICEAVGHAKAELSVVLTDDATIRALNRQWRGKDKPTDVLSFPQADFERTCVLGDIVISVETAGRQAPRYGNDFNAEIDRLLVHGVLHLIGHDHIHGGPQARKMKREEGRVLATLEAQRRPVARRSKAKARPAKAKAKARPAKAKAKARPAKAKAKARPAKAKAKARLAKAKTKAVRRRRAAT